MTKMTGPLGDISYYDENLYKPKEEEKPKNWWDNAKDLGSDAAWKGAGLLKSGFEAADNNNLAATDNSLNDMEIISTKGWDNLTKLDVNSFTKNKTRETVEDTMDGLFRGGLGKNLYGNIVGGLTGITHAAKEFAKKPSLQQLADIYSELLPNPYMQYGKMKPASSQLNDQTNTVDWKNDLRAAKKDYREAYNYAKDLNELDYQERMERTPVGARIGYYGGALGNVARNMKGQIDMRPDNLEDRIRLTQDTLSEEEKRRLEEEERRKRRQGWFW